MRAPYLVTGVTVVIAAAMAAADISLAAFAATAFLVAGTLAIRGRGYLAVGLGAMTYAVALETVYGLFVAPVWRYEGGLPWSAPDGYGLIALTLCAAIPILVLPVRVRRFSEMVVWVLYLLAYIPAIVVGGQILPIDGFLVMATALLASLIIVCLAGHLPRRSLIKPPLSPRHHRIVMGAVGVACLGTIVIVFGVPTSLPNLNDVYVVRADYTNALGGARSLLSYVVTWASLAVFPVVLLLGLRDRSAFLVVMALAGEAVVYAVTGFRTALLMLAALAVAAALGRLTPRWRAASIAWSGALLTLGAGLAAIAGSIQILGLTAYRMMVTPGQLTSFYFEYFTANPVFELRHSILSILGPSPYIVTPPFLIGTTYFRSEEMSANANIWADGLANFGLPGMFAASLVLAGVLWVADGLTLRHPPTLTLALGAIVGWELSNVALLTGLLTGGIALVVLLLAIGEPIPRRQSYATPPRGAKPVLAAVTPPDVPAMKHG